MLELAARPSVAHGQPNGPPHLLHSAKQGLVHERMVSQQQRRRVVMEGVRLVHQKVRGQPVELVPQRAQRCDPFDLVEEPPREQLTVAGQQTAGRHSTCDDVRLPTVNRVQAHCPDLVDLPQSDTVLKENDAPNERACLWLGVQSGEGRPTPIPPVGCGCCTLTFTTQAQSCRATQSEQKNFQRRCRRQLSL